MRKGLYVEQAAPKARSSVLFFPSPAEERNSTVYSCDERMRADTILLAVSSSLFDRWSVWLVSWVEMLLPSSSSGAVPPRMTGAVCGTASRLLRRRLASGMSCARLGKLRAYFFDD